MIQVTVGGTILCKMDYGCDITLCSSSDLRDVTCPPDVSLMSTWMSPQKVFLLSCLFKILHPEGKLWQGARVPLHLRAFLSKPKLKNVIFVHSGKTGTWGGNHSSAPPVWGSGTPGILLKSRELVTAPRASENTRALGNHGRKIWMWTSAC